MGTLGKSEAAKLPSLTYDKDMPLEQLMRLMGYYGPIEPDPYAEVLAAPLVQIFSVCISTNFDECEIYGSIRATEKGGDSFDLYNRDPSESETISKDGALSLTGPEGDAILGTTGVTIDLCLKDRTRNIELIKAHHYIDCVDDDSRDKLMKAVIEGEHGSVCLYYTTFRFAVYAIVEVAICKNPNESGRFDDVHGSLVASYSNSRQYCSTDDEVKYLETKLFEKPPGKPVRVMVESPLKLLRSAVTMPAYSSLIIKAELSGSQDLFTSGLVEFPIHGDYYQHIPFENGHLQVEVQWKIAYPRIYKESVVRLNATAYTTRGSESSTEELLKKVPRALSDQQLVSSSNLNGNECGPQTSIRSKIRGCTGVEIFTVYIGGINHEVSTLCGSIKVDGGSGLFCIYNRSPNDSEPLLDDKTVSIELHKAITNSQFRIDLDLKDHVQNLEISRAEIGWDYGKVGVAASMSWFNKRICSIARGANGYAAVHYMIFRKAVKATLEVSLICDNLADVPINLYGLLCASYGEYEYSTEYEKVYYRSRLFNKPRDKAEKLSTGDRVLLLKSVMVVPTSSSLIIEADLKAIYSGNSHEEVVSGKEEFLNDVCETTCKEIGGGVCRIKVSVKFEYGF